MGQALTPEGPHPLLAVAPGRQGLGPLGRPAELEDLLAAPRSPSSTPSPPRPATPRPRPPTPSPRRDLARPCVMSPTRMAEPALDPEGQGRRGRGRRAPTDRHRPSGEVPARGRGPLDARWRGRRRTRAGSRGPDPSAGRPVEQRLAPGQPPGRLPGLAVVEERRRRVQKPHRTASWTSERSANQWWARTSAAGTRPGRRAGRRRWPRRAGPRPEAPPRRPRRRTARRRRPSGAPRGRAAPTRADAVPGPCAPAPSPPTGHLAPHAGPRPEASQPPQQGIDPTGRPAPAGATRAGVVVGLGVHLRERSRAAAHDGAACHRGATAPSGTERAGHPLSAPALAPCVK